MPRAKKPVRQLRQEVDPYLKKVDLFGLNHDKVRERFEGGLSFVNYVNVGKQGDLVAAVYRASNPNREKGHKEFMLLWQGYDPLTKKEQWMVSGMEMIEIKPYLKVKGMLCTKCGAALYSLYRHHLHFCGCDNTMFIDGGKDYVHAGANKLEDTKRVTINLLTDKITIDKVQVRR